MAPQGKKDPIHSKASSYNKVTIISLIALL